RGYTSLAFRDRRLALRSPAARVRRGPRNRRPADLRTEIGGARANFRGMWTIDVREVVRNIRLVLGLSPRPQSWSTLSKHPRFAWQERSDLPVPTVPGAGAQEMNPGRERTPGSPNQPAGLRAWTELDCRHTPRTPFQCRRLKGSCEPRDRAAGSVRSRQAPRCDERERIRPKERRGAEPTAVATNQPGSGCSGTPGPPSCAATFSGRRASNSYIAAAACPRVRVVVPEVEKMAVSASSLDVPHQSGHDAALARAGWFI